MKKWLYGIVILLIILGAVFVGNQLFQKDNHLNSPNPKNEMNPKNVVEEVDNVIENEVHVSSVEKEKISPKAVLILKKHYNECDHVTKEYAQIPEEFVNLTQEEIEDQYEGWNLETFSTMEVVLVKEMTGVCNQHYVLKEKDGVVAIYQIKEDNSEVLLELTSITIEYLTQNDQLKLKQGIRVDGKEALNSLIEDYE